MRTSAGRAAAFLLLAATAAAQDLPIWSRQQPDGRWSAAADGADAGIAADGDLRATSLMILGLLGDGSTLRTGPHRHFLRDAVRWLRGRQDARGRFALRTDPQWLLDHAIATCALAEAARSAPSAMLAADVRRAVEPLRLAMTTAKPAVAVELRLWCAMTVRALRATGRDNGDGNGDGDGDGDARLLADAALVLERALAALPPAPAGDSPRERAARLLWNALHGEPIDGDAALALLEQPMQEPLATFYATGACFLRGGRVWTEAARRVDERVVRTQSKHGEHRGSWDPQGESGAFVGRLGTSAAAILILEIHYRYSRLAIFRD